MDWLAVPRVVLILLLSAGLTAAVSCSGAAAGDQPAGKPEAPKSSAPAETGPAPEPPEPPTPGAREQAPAGPEQKKEEPTKKKEGQPEEPARRKVVSSVVLAVKLALIADPRLFPYEIEVDVDGQQAALVGEVATEEEKLAATEIAKQVAGVGSVVNRLEVTKGLAGRLILKRDDIITRYVKHRFEESATLREAAFDVKTENGVVSLSGKTRFQVIILEAAEAARRVPGVKAVRTDGVRVQAGD